MNIWKNRNWQPMLLSEKTDPFDSVDFLYELKFDGIRAIIFANKKEVVIKNRNNLDITYLYPELQKIKEIVKNESVFDGEIIIMEAGKSSFEKLQTRLHLKSKKKIAYEAKTNSVVFLCFDLLYEKEDITNYPLIERKKRLNSIKDNEVFIKSMFILKEGKKMFTQVVKQDLEGIVAKNKNSLYLINTRSKDWIKIKNIKSEEFFIGGYIKKSKGRISLVLGEKLENNLFFVGKVLVFSNNFLYKKIENSSPISQSPFFNYEENQAVYLKPKLKCRVFYLERTTDNQLRQPFLKK